MAVRRQHRGRKSSLLWLPLRLVLSAILGSHGALAGNGRRSAGEACEGAVRPKTGDGPLLPSEARAGVASSALEPKIVNVCSRSNPQSLRLLLDIVKHPLFPLFFHVAKLGISCGRSSRYRFRLFCSNTASPERYRSVNTSRVIAAKKNLEAPAKPNVRRPTAKIPPGLNLRVNDRDDHEGQNFKSYKSGAIPSRNPVQYAGRSHIHDHLSIKPRTFRRTARGVDPNNLVCACSQLALVAQQRVHPGFPPPRHQLPLVRDMQTHQRSLPVYTTL